MEDKHILYREIKEKQEDRRSLRTHFALSERQPVGQRLVDFLHISLYVEHKSF